MSNAMRSGKRTLAGVAAGALGAALIPFVGVGVAKADTVSIVPAQTGLTIVKPADIAQGGAAAGQLQTNFPIRVQLIDDQGDPRNITAQETITFAITSAPAGTPSLTAPGNTFALSPDGSSGASLSLARSATVTNQLANGVDGLYTAFISPVVSAAQDGVSGWNAYDDTLVANDRAGVPFGTYNVRVTVFNSVSGVLLTQNIPVIVQPSTVVPAATITWVNNTTGTNPVTSASGTNALAAADAYVRMRDANGYPLIMVSAGRLTADMASATSNSVAATVSSGFAPGTRNPATDGNGIYTVDPTGANWTTATNAYQVSYATTPATTSSLPVVVGNVDIAAGATAALTSTPNLAGSGTPASFVPVGTTTYSFRAVLANANSSGTVAWSIASAAPGAQFTPNAGVAAITQSAGLNVINVTVTANAAAANAVGAGGRITFTAGPGNAGQAQTTVQPATLTPTITTSTNAVGKFGDPVILTGTLSDQFERPLSGAAVVSVARTVPALAGTIASVTPAANGSWSLTLPASVGPTAAANYTFQVTATANGVNATAVNVTVQYTATGSVTSLTAATNPVGAGSQIPAVRTSATGAVTRNNVSLAIIDPAQANVSSIPVGVNGVAYLTFTSTPSTTVRVTAPAGAYMSTTINATPVAVTSGDTEVTVASGTPIAVWTTKPGVNAFTATAGTVTSTASVYAYVPTNAARNVSLTPDKAVLGINQFVSMTAKVTDIFGNTVPGVAIASNGVNTSADVQVGQVGGGFVNTFNTTTNARGEFQFAYTSPNATGRAQVQVVGVAGGTNQFGATIAGVPAAVTTATAEITISSASDKSIVIVGERTTVSGKSGILVDGVVKGIENGKTVKPFIRFPGQTTFTEGSARPVIQAGEFSWQRKTGKRVTVYVTSDDGATISNRVTIQAS